MALRATPNLTASTLDRLLGPLPRDCAGNVIRAYNTSLTALHLASNFLTDPAASSVAATLRASSSVRAVELSNNRIGEAGARALGDALREICGDAERQGCAPVGRVLALSCNPLGASTVQMLNRVLHGERATFPGPASPRRTCDSKLYEVSVASTREVPATEMESASQGPRTCTESQWAGSAAPCATALHCSAASRACRACRTSTRRRRRPRCRACAWRRSSRAAAPPLRAGLLGSTRGARRCPRVQRRGEEA